ncbi:MAG TPA: YqgE/AlgH family protein, partial [Stellaceae bacterium]|nr:YqgE/AlgH family protein [Stellaceae bacterium]
MPRSLAALFGMAALFAAIANAAQDTPPAVNPPVADPPAGDLLIASAELQDPRFAHAVVLLLRHDNNGAFGIVINHPLGERPLAAVLSDADRGDGKDRENGKDSDVAGTIRVFLGGPVQTELGFVVHSAEYRRPETLIVSSDLAMTANPEVLRDIAEHRGPAKYLLALGYAGWGAGQLEGEIARGGWFTTPAEPDLVF